MKINCFFLLCFLLGFSLISAEEVKESSLDEILDSVTDEEEENVVDGAEEIEEEIEEETAAEIKEDAAEAVEEEVSEEIAEKREENTPEEEEATEEVKEGVEEEATEEATEEVKEGVEEEVKEEAEEELYGGDESDIEKESVEDIPLVSLEPEEKERERREEIDDLEELKNDLGVAIDFEEKKSKEGLLDFKDKGQVSESKNFISEQIEADEDDVYDPKKITQEEKRILKISSYLQNKVDTKEWNELSKAANVEVYEIQEGDYLWKICQNLFGSGFFYSKLWSINPYITNPHEIKPGTKLSFTLGDSLNAPELKIGSFEADEEVDTSKYIGSYNLGKDEIPDWIVQREKLKNNGVYLQYTTDKSYEDLLAAGNSINNREYEFYVPEKKELLYDEYSRDKKIDNGFWGDILKQKISYKKGIETHSFVSSNIIEDLGEIKFSPTEETNFTLNKVVFLSFFPTVQAFPGDFYSIYVPAGMMKHEKSEREGYHYSVVGEVQLLRKVEDLYEAKVTKVFDFMPRGSRITTHIPKIIEIAENFNSQIIEGNLIGGRENDKSIFTYGDIIYIDRGRADGLELGNVLDIYNFSDRSLQVEISPRPIEKIGQVIILHLTENFSTALITTAIHEIKKGDYLVTLDSQKILSMKKEKESKSLYEKDIRRLSSDEVELNISDVGQNLLKDAKNIHLSEAEMEEIERLEREKSFMDRGEQDEKALSTLESELNAAQMQLDSIKIDEDRYLERFDLDELEKKAVARQESEFDDLNEIEKDLGAKYMDENLNTNDNPYGLTEFDLEEVSELLNTSKDSL